MADYREPWQLLPQQGSGNLEPLMTPHDCEGRPVISTFIGYEESEAPDIRPEDAERIVACLNACRGIPTEKLGFVWDALFTAMMSAEGTARRGGEPSHYDLMVVYSDCLNAARAMAHAGVNLTELLKQRRLERLDG